MFSALSVEDIADMGLANPVVVSQFILIKHAG